MKKLSMLLAVAALVVGVSANAANNVDLGVNNNTVLNDNLDGSCGTLFLNADGTYENGYAWQYGGCVAPDYGSFAEGYATDNVKACSVVMDISQTGNAVGQTADLYAWEDAAGTPGAVLGVATGFNPGAVAFWPSLSRHAGDIDAACSSTGATWVGYWGNWPGALSAWFIGADLDGFGGLPYTNIAPGIGYPTGWNNVSIVWGPTQALGLGGEFIECGVVPTEERTWGQIKNLYN
jgi:hypothetical protein